MSIVSSIVLPIKLHFKLTNSIPIPFNSIYPSIHHEQLQPKTGSSGISLPSSTGTTTTPCTLNSPTASRISRQRCSSSLQFRSGTRQNYVQRRRRHLLCVLQLLFPLTTQNRRDDTTISSSARAISCTVASFFVCFQFMAWTSFTFNLIV
ncbi:unnamed protein product [Coffea canephora]|uniref:Uncharacterized protein n=1 Tax=Coffea canephora TaxID=49390 RepID=A0A068V5H8_COFCA|nr:unnamed protein product [Coffea canephora]